MQNRSVKKKFKLVRDASGAVAISFALTLAILCGFVALAFDIGHLVMVKAELQRTADAGALAGATGLVPYTGPVTSQTPDWLQGQSKAQTLINNTANLADNQVFTTTDSAVTYGYWLLNPPEGYVQSLPTVRPTTSAYLPQPAIRVTLSRNVDLYFAPLLGVSSPKTVNATATAILPETYRTKNTPPIAVARDIVYDIIGDSVVINVDEQTITPRSNAGSAGWFNLSGENSAPSVRINEALTSPTSAIYLLPGTKATLVGLVTAGETIVLPIVDDVSQKTWMSIVGFAAFKVDNLNANSLEGHFVNKYFDPNVLPADGAGIYLGVAGTPRLVGP